VAYLCRNGRFRSLFLNNIKSHVFVGLHVFKNAWKKRINNPTAIDELCSLHPRDLRNHSSFEAVEALIKESDEWPAKERFYFIAKMVCHASNYGMKAPTFQLNVLEKSDGAIVLTKKECEEFLHLYHYLFPEIHEWHFDVQCELKNGRVLKNLFGERRNFLEPFGEELFKQGYAFIPQSTVGEITNYAFSELCILLDEGKIPSYWMLDILINGHDSILYQYNKDLDAVDEHKLHEFIRPFLERELVSTRGEKFSMKSELQTGFNWGPYKKDVNENGLKNYKYKP